jgi:hypothetical protein
LIGCGSISVRTEPAAKTLAARGAQAKHPKSRTPNAGGAKRRYLFLLAFLRIFGACSIASS